MALEDPGGKMDVDSTSSSSRRGTTCELTPPPSPPPSSQQSRERAEKPREEKTALETMMMKGSSAVLTLKELTDLAKEKGAAERARKMEEGRTGASGSATGSARGAAEKSWTERNGCACECHQRKE